MDLSRIKSEFPAPSYRGHQERALERIRTAFEAGNDVVLVQAPTGSGKSLLARAVAGCSRRSPEAGKPTDAYYTTPQVSQIDDVEEDPLLDDFRVIRGKGNYSCVHDDYPDSPVNRAPCARISNFDCDYIDQCPYFVDRDNALDARIAAMTLAYFLEHAPPQGQFDERDVIIVDEAHGLVDWAEMFGEIEIGPESIPKKQLRQIRPPKINSLVDAANWAGHAYAHLDEQREELDAKEELTAQQVATLSTLERITQDLEWFMDEYHDESTETRWLFEQSDGAGSAVTLRPIDPERVLYHTLWERGEKFLLLSATLLNKQAFCRSVGLSPSRVGFVTLDHTFPLPNRPLVDVTQGKMTYEHRDETIPKVAGVIDYLMGEHHDQKGIIHCHSYDIQDELEKALLFLGNGSRIRSHTQDSRDSQLAQWKATSTPEVLLSVKMEEALDLKCDLARWQVICKAPFLHSDDPRVKARLDNGQWPWYWRQALSTVIQACGRVVRSPEDYGVTYIADSSVLELFNRARSDMPDWFEDQVDAMRSPTLPPLQTPTL